MTNSFTADWVWDAEFCRSTHKSISPNTKRRSGNSFSYTIAVTPFPKFPNMVPKHNLPTQLTVKCRHCKSYVTSYTKVDSNGKGFTCSICNTHNAFSLFGKTRRIPEFQRRYSTYDIQEQKLDNVGKPIDPILFKNRNYLFFIELSVKMVESGTYEQILDKIVKLVETKNFGFVSVFIYNSAITYPSIKHQAQNISLFSTNEIDPVFLPANAFLFNIKSEKELFKKYIGNIKSLKPTKVSITLEKFLSIIPPVTRDNGLDAVVLLSEMEMGSAQGIADLGLNHLVNNCRIDFFCLSETPDSLKYSPITEYTTRTGGNVNIYGVEQREVLTESAMRAAVKARLTKVSINVRYGDGIVLEDIYGCGLRERSKVYSLTSVEQGSTVYYKFDISRMSKSCNIQFQVTFHDRPFNRFIRVIEFQQPFSNMEIISFDVVMASELNSVLESVKVDSRGEQRTMRIAYRSRELLSDEATRSAIASADPVWGARFVAGLKAAAAMSEGVGAVRISGRTPHSIASFLSPECFVIGLNGGLEGPYALSGAPRGTPLLVHVGRRRSVLYLPGEEDLMMWYEGLSEEGPLKEAVSKVSPGDFLEIVSRSGTPGHSALLLIEKLIFLAK